MPSRCVVHIVDDDPEILESVSFMLASEDIATTRHDCAETFVEALPELAPGCIVLDILMPGMSGLELQQHLHRNGCHMPVVIVTGHGDVQSAVAAMKEGAIDFIQKPFAKADLLASVQAAWAEMAKPAPSDDERQQALAMLERLTQREREVVAGLVKGQANKNIAFDMGISPRTVELYRANAMRKLEARSLSELLHIAFIAGG